MTDSSQILVGTFPLCHYNTDLYVLPKEVGGSFYFRPDEKRLPRIKVGLKHPDWSECLEVLLHEVFEAALTTYNHRFARTGKYSNGHDGYVFFFTHAMGRMFQVPFAQGCLYIVVPDRATLPDIGPGIAHNPVRESPTIHIVRPRLEPEQRALWIKNGPPVKAAVDFVMPQYLRPDYNLDDNPLPRIGPMTFKDT